MDHFLATRDESRQQGVTAETVSQPVNALVLSRARKCQLVVRETDAEKAILEYIGCPARDRLRDIQKSHERSFLKCFDTKPLTFVVRDKKMHMQHAP